MKGIFKFTTAALALVALASCSNDDLLGTSQTLEGQAGNALKVEIEDLVDPVTTRAAYVPDGTSNKLYWQNWDAIRVYDDALLKNDTYVFSEKRGTFENNSKDNVKTPVYAFTDDNFQSGAWDSDKDQVYVSYTISDSPAAGVDDEVASTKGNKVKAYEFSIPMWGEAKSEDGKVSVSMKYLTGVLRVQLTQLPSDVAQIRVRGYLDQACNNTAPMTGDFKAVVSEDDEINPDAQLVKYPITESPSATYGNELKVNFSDWDVEEWDAVRKDGGYVYFPLIAQDYGALLFEYKATGASGWTLIKKTKPVSVKRGNVYRMNIEELEIAGSDAESVNVLLQQKKDETGAVVVKTTYPTEMSTASYYGTTTKNVISIPAGMAAESLTLDLAGITGNGLPFEVESEDGKFAGDFVLDLSDGKVATLNNIYLNLPNSNVVLKGDFAGATLGKADQNKLIVKSLTIAAVDQDDLDKGNANTTIGNIYPNYESFSTGEGIVVAKGAKVGNIDMTRISENKDKYIAESSITIYGTAGTITANCKNPAYTVDKKDYYQVVPVTVDGGTVDVIKTASNIDIKGKANIKTSATSIWGDITAAGESTSKNLEATNQKIAMSEKATAEKADAPTVELSGSANVTIAVGSSINAASLSITEKAWAEAATVKAEGAATINLSQEQVAVKDELTLNNKATLTLTQGYIQTITGDAAKVTFGEGEGFTAIASATDLTATNASTWNGKKIGKDFAAYVVDNIWTACQFASHGFATAITLENSIDLNNQAWTPVELKANVSGNDKTIKNVKVTASADNAGLFSKISAGGTIEKLTIDGAAIAATGKSNVGVLAGSATVDLTLTKVVVKNATVEGKYFLGGLVGDVKAADVDKDSNANGVTFTVNTPNNNPSLSDTSDAKAGSVGQFFGQIDGAVTVPAFTSSIDPAKMGFKGNFHVVSGTKAYCYYGGTSAIGLAKASSTLTIGTDAWTLDTTDKDEKAKATDKIFGYYLLITKF